MTRACPAPLRDAVEAVEQGFHFDDTSPEAAKARAAAIDLITAWLGAGAIPPGEEQTRFLADNFWAKVLPMDSGETAHLIYGLTLVGVLLVRPASRLPDALNLLNEFDVDTEAFIAEHPGDPLAYLHTIETIIERFNRGEPLGDEDDQEPLDDEDEPTWGGFWTD